MKNLGCRVRLGANIGQTLLISNYIICTNVLLFLEEIHILKALKLQITQLVSTKSLIHDMATGMFAVLECSPYSWKANVTLPLPFSWKAIVPEVLTPGSQWGHVDLSDSGSLTKQMAIPDWSVYPDSRRW